jgi:hypothetical protein
MAGGFNADLSSDYFYDSYDSYDYAQNALNVAAASAEVDALAATFDADADRAGAGRYFSAPITNAPTVAPTATMPTTNNQCWKCDAMDFTDCGANGKLQTCQVCEKILS